MFADDRSRFTRVRDKIKKVIDGPEVLTLRSIVREALMTREVRAHVITLVLSTHPENAASLPSLRHRLILNFEGEAEGATGEQVFQKILIGSRRG